MSSTFLIHPFENGEHLKSTDAISPTSISNNTLSRLFDIPVDLLDKSEPSPTFNSFVDEQSMFWAPASKHPELTPAEFEGGTVTHSFANRKRSYVKRRKSVLSSSFTPNDEDEDEDMDEQEAIRNDREATLAALERKSPMQPLKEGKSKKKNKGLRRSVSLTLPNTTPDYNLSDKQKVTITKLLSKDIRGSPVLLFHRGSVLRRGEKSKFRRRSSCDTPSEVAPSYLENEENPENQGQEEKESITEKQELSLATQISPKDSVIDLSSTESVHLEEEQEEKEKKQKEGEEEEEQVDSSNNKSDTFITKVIDLSLSTEATENYYYKIPTPPPSPPLVALAGEKKPPSSTPKKSWSRRLFSTKSKKMHEPVQLTVDEIDHNSIVVVDDIDDGRQNNNTSSKFNLSSLFSTTKKYSGYGSLRKKKSSASFSFSTTNTAASTTGGLERNSPYSSSTDTLIPCHHPSPASSSKDVQLANFNYTRLPIHTERAIYRLSHIKLTHPRRPLRDQVMISNLMFWYLSIINQSNCNPTNEMEQQDYNINSSNNSMALIKKAYGIPTTGSTKSRGSKKRSNKRLRHQPTRTTNSNAMDLIKNTSVGSKNPSRRHYTRTSNSSSEESDSDDSDDDNEEEGEEEDNDAMSLIDEDDDDVDFDGNIMIHYTSKQQKKKKNKKEGGEKKNKPKKKYSLFKYGKSNNSSNSWLPSFSSPKSQSVRQDEDDIPLAMYKKSRS